MRARTHTGQIEYWYERIVEEEPLLANVEGVQDYEYRLGTEVGEDRGKVARYLDLIFLCCITSLYLVSIPLSFRSLTPSRLPLRSLRSHA